MRLYAKVILGVLIVGSVVGGIGWGLRALYDAGGDAREAEIRLEWHEERQALLTRVEPEIQKERIVYRDRIQKIREVVNQCVIPDELIGLLRDSRIFRR